MNYFVLSTKSKCTLYIANIYRTKNKEVGT